MIVYKVKFATSQQDVEKTFSYLPTKKAALQWVKDGCPHEAILGYNVTIEPIQLPTTSKKMCGFLNRHHTFW